MNFNYEICGSVLFTFPDTKHIFNFTGSYTGFYCPPRKVTKYR